MNILNIMKKKLKIIGVSILCLLVFGLFFFIDPFQGPTVELSVYPLTGEHYFKNNHHVFYEVHGGRGCDNCAVEKQEILGADPKTFEVLNRDYVKDKNNVYICSWTGPDAFRISTKCETIQNIDYNSFVLIGDPKSGFDYSGDYYAKDKSHVYFYGRVIANADPLSFQIIDDEYARDTGRIYYRDNYRRFHIVKEVKNTSEIIEFFSEDHKSIEEELRKKLIPTIEAFQ